jgi:hypothetical protein
MSKPHDSHFKLIEVDGYREEELVKAPTLEELEAALELKTGGR